METVNVVTHPVGPNFLLIENKRHYGLDVEKVIVGVENPDKSEIVKNPRTGLNYSRNAVEGQEIYNSRTEIRSCWFMLDLETGSRGWFPGSEIHGDILGEFEIKAEPNESSETLLKSSNVTLKILDIETPEEVVSLTWLKVTHLNVTGYVKKTVVSNIRYDVPFSLQ